jgi:phage shock protein C
MIEGMNTANQGKRLLRRREGRIVAGVCTGLAAHFDVDANIVRLVFVGLTVLWALGPLIYVVAWAIVPEEGEDSSIAESFVNKRRGG